MNQAFFRNLLPSTLLFNRFELHRCLGSTAQHGVYYCFDRKRGGRPAVIKVFWVAGADELARATFERETALCRYLAHPNVVRGEEIFRDEECIALCMGYVDGGSLLDWMGERESLNPQIVIDILNQVGAGLRAVHRVGMLHRDLNPANILVDTRGAFKIADFGFSTAMQSPNQLSVSETGATDEYRAPEALNSGDESARSDIYSLGVTAYRLLTGLLPSQRRGGLLRGSTPLRPDKIDSDIPEALSTLVMKAIARNPQERFQNMDEFLTALQAVKTLLYVRGGSLPEICWFVGERDMVSAA